jgi:putative spermidine/putrescine transport system substrate-binding protein
MIPTKRRDEMRVRWYRVLAALIAGVMLLAACAPAAAPTEAPAAAPTDAPAAAPTDAPAADPMAELYAAAQAEGMLTTIALPHDWCNYAAVFEGFKAKYPGIVVNELDPGAGSGEELEAIRANMGNPGPQAPDVIDVGLAFGPTAKDEGLIQYMVAT